MVMVLTAALLFFVLLALTLMLKPKPEQMKLTKRQVYVFVSVFVFVLGAYCFGTETSADVAHEKTGQVPITPSPSSTSPLLC